MFEFMENRDWIMVAAIILGPVLAVQVQKIISSLQQKKNRRLKLFFTLMSTRGTPLEPDRVTALNMIDIEFYGRRIFGFRLETSGEKKVINSWKTYNDHLNTKYPPDRLADWDEKSDRLFIEILYAISQALSYGFDKVKLKRDHYRPAGHYDLQNQEHEIRQGLANVLSHKTPIPVVVTYLHDEKTQPTEDDNG